MIKAVDAVNIYVRDQEKSVRFFVDVLEFTVREDRLLSDGVRWVTVAPPGSQGCLALCGKEATGFAEEKVGSFAHLQFLTSDARATYEELNARGVRFTRVPRQMPFGVLGGFLDVDDNEYDLLERRPVAG